MLQKETKILSSDNTGVGLLQCIHVQNKKKYGTIGDILNVVVKKFKVQKNLVKKQIYCGLIICLKSIVYRLNGIYVKSDQNRVLLLNRESLQFLGTRIYTPVYKEIRQFTVGKKKLLRYEKIVSLTKKFI